MSQILRHPYNRRSLTRFPIFTVPVNVSSLSYCSLSATIQSRSWGLHVTGKREHSLIWKRYSRLQARTTAKKSVRRRSLRRELA